MASVLDLRWGVSDEVKNKVIPIADKTGFLGYDEDDRISLYIFAAALATKLQMTPKSETFKGLVMMKSVSDEEIAQLLLMYLMGNAKKSLDSVIDNVGESRRKEVVQYINQVANAGFQVVKELNSRNEDLVIADLIDEMNRDYADFQKKHPEYKLPVYHDFEAKQ
ncbi:MAG: hypothetical protein MJ109_02035 [Kiritimatiellae bacterium]|nr:hypothetical protein [Kiritimatiellia bacterium]